MSTPDLRRWWVRLAQAAGLVAMGLLALFDLRLGAPGESGRSAAPDGARTARRCGRAAREVK
ncbi:hypothetical protein ACTMSW_29110 [Micromonospora sp. BQ11]|uniref:hypothetical protein n=1 Tax=Micromonospora sp. BQ11 TaxID=3452212 RepID=UPI003F8BA446